MNAEDALYRLSWYMGQMRKHATASPFSERNAQEVDLYVAEARVLAQALRALGNYANQDRIEGCLAQLSRTITEAQGQIESARSAEQ